MDLAAPSSSLTFCSPRLAASAAPAAICCALDFAGILTFPPLCQSNNYSQTECLS